MTTYRTILLRKPVPVHMERTAGDTITPGMILDLNSSDNFIPHGTASGDVCPLIVAVEDDLEGRTITDDYDVTTYTRVQAEVLHPGDEFYGLLADGETAVIGSYLKSGGDGYMKVYTVASGEPDYTRVICARALEAVDRSSSSGGDTNVTGRIRCVAV